MNKIILMFILIFFSGCPFAYAEGNVKLIVFTEQNPPYNWEEDGEVKGFSTQIVKEMLTRADLEYSIRCTSWNGAYQNTMNHENAMIYSIVRMKIRENLFRWIGPLAPYQVHLFKLKSRNDIKISSLEDVKKYKVGVVKNDARHLFFQKKKGYQLDIVREDTFNIKKLFSQRVDLTPFQENTLMQRIDGLKEYSFDDLEKVLLLDELTLDYYAAFGNKTSDEIIIKCRNALASMKDDGTFNEISNQYYIPGL